jgi:serine/threonine protein phosphatase PrpC
MAAEIDEMVKQGRLTKCEAINHPDRQMLTSALTGKRINKIDCTGKSLTLLPGDIVLVASDGLRFLPQKRIVDLVNSSFGSPSQTIAHHFKSEIDLLAHEDQDNVSMSIVKVLP